MIKKSLFFSFFLSLFSCSVSGDDVKKQEPPIENIPELDALIQDYMSKYKVPGMQVAVTRQGKLVYAKGYGKADVSANEDVKNESLFRVASISKPITGIAIMRLVEEGRIKLNDRVFGTGNLLGTSYGNVNATLASITVAQLLHHTSGGWGNSQNDPMFTNPQMTADQLITWTLANRPLTSTPGSRFDYSNFGYCVLGRVIEKVTGQTYEQYVNSALLHPSNIQQMSIGGNQLKDRKPNEVVYYGQNNENPYLYNITRMDAHGGWIASATDLARLMVKADGFSSPPDLLSSQSITQMTTGSSAEGGYALGWSVNSANNWWHTGSLPGSTSILVRTSSGYTWALLCNSRISSAQFNSDLDELMWKVVNNPSVKWPERDLFLLPVNSN